MQRHFLGLLLGMWLCAPFTGRGQGVDSDPLAPQDTEEKAPARKGPSWFHRPARATPAEQLALADAQRAQGRLRKAAGSYNSVVHAWHNSPEAVQAQQRLADVQLARGRMDKAFDEYQYLCDFFPGQFPYESVLERQFEIADRTKTRRVGKFLFLPGLVDPERAIPMFEKIAANAPQWPRAQQALYYVALIQEEAGNLAEAIATYEKILQRYPRGSHTAQASFSRARCQDRRASERGRDEGRLRDAISAYSVFLRDYPADPNAKTAQARLDTLKTALAQMYFDRARFYDTVRRNPKAAIIAYRDLIRTFPMSDLRERAEQRIAELTAGGEKPNGK